MMDGGLKEFEPKRVLLWIESSRAYGRGCLLGIADYCRTHDPWRLVHVERDLEQTVPPFLAAMRFDGVISRSENREIAEALESLGVPIVDLRGAIQPTHGHMIDTDPSACAELAFEHFWERGLSTMAFCGYEGVDWSDRRRDAFAAYSSERNIKISVFQSRAQPERHGTLWHEAQGEREDPGLSAWLRALPKPVAVFAANDEIAVGIANAARERGLEMPRDVRLVGFDDSRICTLLRPEISSVRIPIPELASEAIDALVRRIEHPEQDPKHTRLATSLIVRDSSRIGAGA